MEATLRKGLQTTAIAAIALLCTQASPAAEEAGLLKDQLIKISRDSTLSIQDNGKTLTYKFSTEGDAGRHGLYTKDGNYLLLYVSFDSLTKRASISMLGNKTDFSAEAEKTITGLKGNASIALQIRLHDGQIGLSISEVDKRENRVLFGTQWNDDAPGFSVGYAYSLQNVGIWHQQRERYVPL